MAKKMAKELIIPKCEGRAFEVMKGQVFRVIEIEGKQVGDMTLLNLHDFKETFNGMVTTSANGNWFTKVAKLYSGPPFFNAMVSVVDDKTGVHWVYGRCTRFTYKHHYGLDNHRSCQDNIVEALAPYGLSEYDIPFGTLNIFMNVRVDEKGQYTFEPPVAEKGDYIDFLAEMDLLVAISACPMDLSAVNDYAPKPLKVEIF